jgi:hypothetical protein
MRDTIGTAIHVNLPEVTIEEAEVTSPGGPGRDLAVHRLRRHLGHELRAHA